MKWECMICGYIHEGPEPPPRCPICGVSARGFRRLTEPYGSEAKAT